MKRGMMLGALSVHLVTGLGLVLTSSLAQAQQIYKWADEKGALHYSQTPPPARYSKAVDVKARVTTPTPAASATANKEAGKTGDPANPAPAKPQTPKFSAETCQTMQNNLAQLQTGRRLYEKDTGGERAYITEERRAQQIQIYQQNLKNGCS